MNTATTLGGYALGLVAVFAAATAVGSAVGPVGRVRPAHETAGHEAPGDSHAGGHSAATAAAAPAGLSAYQDGYALRLDRPDLRAGEPGRLSFVVTGADGSPLRDYRTTHDKELHLIVVRRDLTGYQHVHPERDAAGTWSVDLTLAEPGQYKVFADFQPPTAERAITLGADLAVPGDYRPAPLPAPARTSAVDGYTISLTGDLVAGRESEVTLSVSREGRPVTDLEPYLGAYGHLVVLRAADLAYLHVHPLGEGTPGPGISFAAQVPTAGDYRLFLDFKHAGQVRTAELTAHVAPGTEGHR